MDQPSVSVNIKPSKTETETPQNRCEYSIPEGSISEISYFDESTMALSEIFDGVIEMLKI